LNFYVVIDCWEIFLMTLIEKCIVFALKAHSGQTDRLGRPYILHPLHLMAQVETEEEQMTAVLHDVVEDTDTTLADLQDLGLPESVLTAVALLTHDKEGVAYDVYVERLKSNAIARKVKMADLRHNMDIRRLPEVQERDAARMEKYRRAWITLTT
jgi:(p)ppGpp synthase/HD superfamily hydrolase